MLKAFTIFAKYNAEDNVSAGHDEIWAGPDPEVVSAEDLAILESLGWYPHDECFRKFVN